MSMQFEHLFTPIELGPVTVRNRIVLPSHATRFPFFADDTDGSQYIEYMRARARGGCGLIVIGTVHGHKSHSRMGLLEPPTPEILAPKLRILADAVHEYSTKVVLQVWHKGNTADSSENIRAMWGFTARPSPDSRQEVCHEMDDIDIDEVINGYPYPFAVLAKECGIDGVEIHGAHGYLLQQSWTNWANLRVDKWGEQMAFANEVINRTRAAVGDDYLLGMRIASDDFHANGMDNEAMQKVAQQLEATGKLDYISLSEGSQLSHYSLIMGTMYVPPAAWIPLHSGIKQAVKFIPVIASCRINEPTLAESILADGHADMVAICRGQIADPEFANKAREGRVDDIRLCIACNQGCADRLFSRIQITCLQNCTVGQERELGTIEPAPNKKKVVVIGGGPGGLETARVAVLRGHDVTLYEKENQLGGQINTLTKVPAREEFGQAIRYLTTQVNKLGVNVKLGVEATAEMVLGEKADAVVVATGAMPYRLPIPGVDQENVFTVSEVLDGAPVGEKVIIFDTTGLQEAPTCAEFLADQGKQVEVITFFPMVAAMMGYTHQPLVWPRLKNKGIVFTVYTMLKKISGRTVTVGDVYTEEERTIGDVDTVVLATGYRVDDSLYRTLRGKVDDLYAVGDCYAPRRVLDAIHEGYKHARKL